MAAAPRSWIRWAVLAGALGLGTWLRLRGLPSLPLHGDEYHTLLAADTGYGSILSTFDKVGSHVPLPLLQRLSLDLFGPGVVSFRLVAIVPGLLFLLLCYPLLRPFVGANAAALATAGLALNPMVVYYARFARGYALALLLALVLGWAVRTVLEPSKRCRSSWSALIASAALLSWVHLSALGFVLAVACAGLALAARESRALALRFCGAFALAGALALLLFLPVIGQVLAYFREMKSEPPPLSWFGVPTLLFGGRTAACAWLACLALGAASCWRARRASVKLALAALLGPLALLLVSNPRGMDYAWARYLLSALPFLVGLAGAGFLGLAGRLLRDERPALVAGFVLLLVQHWAGPIGPRSTRDPGFSNTYLALHALPAFDVPYPETPAFYLTLARDPAPLRIVEATPLFTRAVLLYRNYALQHGKQVLHGWTGEPPRGIDGPPYVRVLEVGPEQADYLVLHKDQVAEVPEYFRFVYETVWPRLRTNADDTFMRRQETIYGQNLLDAEKIAPVAARLLSKHGPAFYKDEHILVWKLAR